MIDTFYGALAQFLHIFLGQKQEKCDLKKMDFHRLSLEHRKDTFFIQKKVITIYLTIIVYLKWPNAKIS